MSYLISFVWNDDLESVFRKTVFLMKHQTTDTGLLIDPDGQWIKMMTSHVLGTRWLSPWPRADLWVTEPCHQGAGTGEALKPTGVL